ncbi:MAG: SDR family oxidoreductase [Acidimicrobiia bacterium]|nr:SDR family oxidoreductase [Acidimicrobiia bacterium]
MSDHPDTVNAILRYLPATAWSVALVSKDAHGTRLFAPDIAQRGDSEGDDMALREFEPTGSAREVISEVASSFQPPSALVYVLSLSNTYAAFDALEGRIWQSEAADQLAEFSRFTREAALAMRDHRRGRLVNIAIGGISAEGETSHLAAVKGGVTGYTKAIARELAPNGVAVNGIIERYIPGDTNRASVADGVGRSVAYLLSAGAGSMVGQILYLPGPVVAGETL